MTTTPRPWTPEGRALAERPRPVTSARFSGLDTTLLVLMGLAAVALVFSVIIAFADSDPAAFMVAGSSLMTMILCGLGRVMIHMAQTLDRMAADAREVRGISEWWLRNRGVAGLPPTPEMPNAAP